MALVLNDRVKESTTTTGTGTVNLGGAATGFETFVAGVGNSNTTYYCIAGQGTAEFEVGIGTVTDASPDTLSRTTILSSSNSDSAVNFSAGTKDVFCTLPASKTIREVDTALNVPTGTTAQRAGSPAAGDFRYNTTNNKFEGYSTQWNTIGSGTNMDTNIFAGDGSDTTFTLSTAPDTENNLIVFIDGVFQAQNVYSVSGTTLTFATAPANGRVITAYHSTTTVGGSNNTIATMTGDNSDTTLSLPTAPVSENNVFVYFDGVYQSKSNYSISGTTLTFSTAPPTGVLVEAITATNTSITTATQLVDADGDTKVMVEESSDEDKIRFDTGGTERAIIDSTGLGIGTSSPSDPLVVSDSGASSITARLINTNADANPANLRLQKLSGSPADGDYIGMINVSGENDASEETIFQSIDFISTDVSDGSEDGVIAFRTRGAGSLAERMRIDSSGNIGIGLTNPSAYGKLAVTGTATQLALNASSGKSRIGFFEAGTGRFYIDTLNGADGLAFVDADGSTERMRIDSSGNVIVGSTSSSSTTGHGHKFKVDGTKPYIVSVVDTNENHHSNYHHYNANATYNGYRFYIRNNGGVVNYSGNNVNLSDEKVKTNIELSGNYLEKICNIPVKLFNYKDEPEGVAKSLGVIAQDVEDVAPELINNEGFGDTPEDGVPLKTVYTTDMMYALMKAIQEQQEIIDDLKTRIEVLEA